MRPPIPEQVFRDAHGTVIDYGRRWGWDSPPDDTYSVTSNLERYAPLHAVAEALIAWLVETYDATAAEDPARVADALAHKIEARRAVTVTPADDRAAPITLVFTSFPGLIMHAGVLYDDRMPHCGCDACDEGVLDLAEELEHKVFAVVTGGFSELISGRVKVTIAHSLQLPDVGGWGGEGRTAEDIDPETLHAARQRLKDVGQWRAWPERGGSAVGYAD